MVLETSISIDKNRIVTMVATNSGSAALLYCSSAKNWKKSDEVDGVIVTFSIEFVLTYEWNRCQHGSVL